MVSLERPLLPEGHSGRAQQALALPAPDRRPAADPAIGLELSPVVVAALLEVIRRSMNVLVKWIEAAIERPRSFADPR